VNCAISRVEDLGISMDQDGLVAVIDGVVIVKFHSTFQSTTGHFDCAGIDSV
jgi:hypothetical protein